MHATFIGDGRYVATASGDRTACIWDLTTGHWLTPPFVHPNRVFNAWFSPDSSRCVTAMEDGACRVWRLPQPRFSQSELPRIATLYSAEKRDAANRPNPVTRSDLRSLWPPDTAPAAATAVPGITPAQPDSGKKVDEILPKCTPPEDIGRRLSARVHVASTEPRS